MSRSRTPPAVAKATGAADRNPGRFSGRNDPTSPLLGPPSRWMTADQKKAWKMFADELPWLVESDRPMLEVAATLRALLIAGKGMAINNTQVYSAVLSKLGATPADRSRTQPLSAAEEEDEFFGRG